MKAERLLSFIAAVLAPLPCLIASVLSANDEIRLVSSLFCLGGAAVSWLLGIALGMWLKKADKQKAVFILNTMKIAVGVAIAAGCEVLLFLFSVDSRAMIFLPIGLIFCYTMGIRAGNGSECVNFAIMGAFFVSAIFAYPVCASEENNGAAFAAAVFAVTIVFIILSAVIINLRNLEYISHREDGAASLSKSLVRFNVKRTLWIMGILLLVFFLAPPLAGLLWDGAREFVRWLLELLERLGQQPTEVDPVGSQLEEPGNITFRRTFIGEIVMFISVAAVIVLLAKPVINALAKLLRELKRWLGIKDEYRTATSEYTDVYEESGSSRRRGDTFKKAYKAFAREKDPTKKYRLGYKAYMIKLKETAPSDTTGKHLVKGRRIYGDDMRGQLEDTVSGYDSLRYNDKVPTEEELNKLSGMLKDLAKKR